ncbi:hypothetical protein [Spirosoma foliorum]|uniref:Uncharacterized protein n=1 Tax=Spirosoma foliorum TaxID=2710596 RepID=A0A7G5H5K8_9BACT|nr:hypothetical protein [Spirosoma foliorum]QMW06400.1 hypothetical protein H3H32_16655 [Spirosoma foliorum]
MSEKEFAVAVLAVNSLPFVDTVNVPANVGIAFVELSPRLTEVLPPARSVLQINRDDFSVEEVIRLYNVYVVEHLNEVAGLAHQLLREAQYQQRKKRQPQ